MHHTDPEVVWEEGWRNIRVLVLGIEHIPLKKFTRLPGVYLWRDKLSKRSILNVDLSNIEKLF